MAEECCKVNFLQSAADSLKRVVQDPTRVSEEQQESRMSICRSCEHFDANRTVCKQCGCFLQLKTQFANMRCPIGKWHELQNSNT
jgi:hypothetical protein